MTIEITIVRGGICINHVTLGIYPDKSYKYNVVRDEDLDAHITCNILARPGRLLYVDGERVYDACIKKEKLSEYDKIAESFYKDVYTNKSISLHTPTIPYR